jgi:thiamine-phosphate pyrophosphorylase
LARCYTDFVLLLYYITGRMQLGDDESSRRQKLLEKIEAAAHTGVDCIQLRERDLTARELERLAILAVEAVRSARFKTKLLINSRVDVALAAGVDGVHLRADDMAASEARAIWAKSAGRADCVIAVSCHSLEDVLRAEAHGADFVVLGPVFGKQGSVEPPLGVEAIARIVRRGGPVDRKAEAGQSLRMPVIALGGITGENAAACLRAGAAGVAGIRLFQDGNVAETVARLRSS